MKVVIIIIIRRASRKSLVCHFPAPLSRVSINEPSPVISERATRTRLFAFTSLRFLPPSTRSPPVPSSSARSVYFLNLSVAFCCCWRAYINPSSSSFAPFSMLHTIRLVQTTLSSITVERPSLTTPPSSTQNMHNTYDDEFPLLRLAGLYAADIRGDGMFTSLFAFPKVCSFGTC